MTIEDKIAAFRNGRCVLSAEDIIYYDRFGYLTWAIPEYDTKGKKTKEYTTLAWRKIPKSKNDLHTVTVFDAGRKARSRLLALGEVYGFTISRSDYFIATRKLHTVGFEPVRKGGVLGHYNAMIVIGGR